MDIDLSLKEKLLLWLGHVNRPVEDMISEDRREKVINTLEKDGYLSRIGDDLELTDQGEERCGEIWDELKDKKILVSDNSDSIQLTIEEIDKVYDKTPITSIIEDISDDKIVFGTKSRDITKLIGREDELDELKDAVEDLKDSEGSTYFIRGSTGVGKSRLANEIKELSKEEEFDFIKGECQIEEYNPYNPFKKALDKFIRCGRGLEMEGRIIVGQGDKSSNIESKEMFDALKKSTFYDTTQYIKKLSNDRPLVILLDDLQWADKSSLNLLDYMTDRLKECPVLFLCTYRPGDVPQNDPLRETIRRMSRKKIFEKIDLEPLDKDETEELIKDVTGISGIPENFTDHMFEKTNGNPLFIKESLKQMIEEQLIDLEEGRFPDTSKIILVPDLIEDVIERRIINFPKDTRRILQLGSVIGKEVPYDLLVKASDMDELELLDHIDTLMESRLWFEHSQRESFIFSHDLIADTIYNGTGRWLERKSLHVQVGEAIENLYRSQLEENYSILAYHFKNGDEYTKAFRYYIKAGERAENVYAHEDAIQKYREGLKLTSRINEIDEGEVFDALERIADAYSIIGGYEDCRSFLKQALSKTSDPEEKRRMYRKIAQTWVNQGKYGKALSIIEDGLNIEEKEGEREYEMTPEICRLLSEKGWAKRRQGEYDEGHEIFKLELEIAEKVKDGRALSQAYHDLGTSAKSNRDYDKGIEYLQNAIKIRRDLDDKKGLSKSLNNLGIIYYQMGDYDESLKYFEKSYELDKEIGRKLGEGRSLHNIGLLYQNKGEMENALEFYEKSYDIKTRIGDKQGLGRVKNSIGLAYEEMGEFSKALEYLDESIDIFEEIDDNYGKGMSYYNKSEVYIYKGDLNSAEDNARRSYEISEKIKNDHRISQALDNLGIISRLRGDLDGSIDHHQNGIEVASKSDNKRGVITNRLNLAESYLMKEEIEKAEEQLGLADEEELDIPVYKTKRDMVKGIILRERGDLDQAEEVFEGVLEDVKRLNKRYREARLYHELGLLKKKQNDISGCSEYLDRAVKMFDDMGMDLQSKKSTEVLEQIS